MLSFLHYNTELISVIWTEMRWTLACTLLHFTFALKNDFIEIGFHLVYKIFLSKIVDFFCGN